MSLVEPLSSLNDEVHELEFTQANLSQLSEMLYSSDKENQLKGLIGIRKMLSVEVDTPINEVIEANVVPKILNLMTSESDPRFQVEAAWIITNICSGTSENVEYIVKLGSLEKILTLFQSNNEQVVDQAIWAIGNIAGDNINYRNLCLDLGLMPIIVTAIARFPHSYNVKKDAIWTVSNLIKGKPAPSIEQISYAFPLLAVFVSLPFTDEALTDTLWSISYASDICPQAIIDIGCVPHLLNHLQNDNPYIMNPTLRALGNILTGDDVQTNAVLSYPEFLPRVFDLTSHPTDHIKKEAFWAISNVAAGNPEQIQMILGQPSYMKILKEGLMQYPENVAVEGAWCITNMLSGANPWQIEVMVKEHNYLECLLKILDLPKKIKLQALEAACKILRAGKLTNKLETYIESFNEIGLTEKIMNFPNSTHKDTIKHIKNIKNLLESKGSDDEGEEKSEASDEESESGTEEDNKQSEEGDADEDEDEHEDENEDKDEDKLYQNLAKED